MFIAALIFTGCNLVNSKNSEKNTSNDYSKVSLKTTGSKENQKIPATDSNRCNLEIVLEVDEDLDDLTDKQIYLFLYSFDESCANNTEFGEYSNEVLFKVLNKYPGLLALNLIKEGINKDVILYALSSPVSELSNIEVTYNNVLKSNINKKIKQDLLEALKKD